MDILGPDITPTTVEEWLELGIEKGWVSSPFCGTHDTSPMTAEEEQQWEDGSDPCSGHVRIWPEGKPDNVLYGREGW